MSVNHLSEKRIQEYLDNKLKGLDAEEQDHLETCDRCQGALCEYRRLYGELRKDERNLLSSDFTSRTMILIREQVLPAAGMGRANLAFLLCGVLSCVIALVYLFDLKALLDTMLSFSLESKVSESSVVTSLTEMTTGLGPALPIVIFAGLLLIGVALVDKLLVRQKSTRAYFLSV